MNMQDVQVVNLRYLRHARGQREIVRRILEQRILRYSNFVEKNLGVAGVQSDGLLVSDEMDFMPAGSQLNAQLRSHHSAATVGWVACNPDFHAVLAFWLLAFSFDSTKCLSV